jgi:hypothetical protein
MLVDRSKFRITYLREWPSRDGIEKAIVTPSFQIAPCTNKLDVKRRHVADARRHHETDQKEPTTAHPCNVPVHEEKKKKKDKSNS